MPQKPRKSRTAFRQGRKDLALYKKATLGTAGTQIAIALVELPVANVPEHDIFNYKPLELRVYDGSKVIAKKEIEEGVYPCALVVDEFSTKGVNQVAFAWVSVGNTHSGWCDYVRVEIEDEYEKESMDAFIDNLGSTNAC